MTVNCTEIRTINQFKNRVFVYYLSFYRVIHHLLSKTVSILMKAKIVRFLSDLNIEDGINSKDAAFASYGG